MTRHVDLIHVGYHRCASTTLQDILFSNHPKITMTKNSRLAYDKAVGIDDVPFNGCSFSSREDQTTVISSEGLCGVNYTQRKLGNAWQEFPKLIHDKWPDAKILIIIRRQPDLIRSYYSLNIIKFATVLSPKMYYGDLFCKEYLNYDSLITNYVNLFGAKKVCALPFEMIRHNQSQFLSRLSDFSCVDFRNFPLPIINAGNSDIANEVMRRLNYFFRILGNQRPLGTGKKKLRTALATMLPQSGNKFFDGDDEVEIRNYFAESNKRISSLIGIDLVKEYGY